MCRREGRSIWPCTLPMSTIQNHCSDDEANSWRNKSAVHRKIQFCNMTSGGRTATLTHMEHTRIHTLCEAHGVYLTPLRLSQHPTALTCQPTRRSGSPPASQLTLQPAIVAANLTVTAATVTAVVSCCCCCCCLCHGAVQRCSFAGFRWQPCGCLCHQ